MKVAIGADHAGLALKQQIVPWLAEAGYEVVDLGAQVFDKDDDYPDFAAAVGRAVASGQVRRGILVCGSGVGASIAANKIQGVRACLCHDIYSATQGVEHDDMNVLCLGGSIIGPALAKMLVAGFLEAAFLDYGRYLRRLKKVLIIEEAGR